MKRISVAPVALSVSLLAHLLLAFAMSQPEETAPGTGQPRLMQVRTLLLSAAGAGTQMAPDASLPASTAVAEVSVSSPSFDGSLTHTAREQDVPLDSSTPTQSSETRVTFPAARYFPVHELTDKPKALNDIPPEKVAVLADVVLHPLRAQLLINEDGEVDRVVFEDVSLSAEARQLVSDSFAGVKFTPGKFGDLAVKSMIDIEFSFEQAPQRRTVR